jgi:hypothetical protein
MTIRNKTLSFLFAAMLLLSTYVYSAEVGPKAASDVARNFFYEQVAQSRGIQYSDLKIIDYHSAFTQGLSDYHVFNFDQGGWVIVAGDDLVKPILAYSPEGSWIPSMIGPATRAWMDETAMAIAWYRQQNQSDASLSTLWQRYLSNDISQFSRPATRGDVAPFTRSKWGQGKYYNTFCPADPAGDDGHALVGCVATSIAQVMYYYRHPETGTSSHGYYANNSSAGYGDYGYQFVNFAQTTYDWEGMNDQITGSNANLAAAELCYSAGVAVDMKYGPSASGSQTQYAAAALKTYFGYTNSILFVQRMSYTASQWDNALKNNLASGKPVIYAGSQVAGSGHAWIFDGYDTTSQGTFYHCNWGWDGMSDGYFSIDNLGPNGEPPFSAFQSAVVNIYPAGSYPPSCSSTKTVTMRNGSVTDQSGPLEYENNRDCYWLIDPQDSVSKIIMTFDYFNVADDNDKVTIYDGSSSSAPILATYSLSSQPSGNLTSNGSKVLVRFQTDGTGTADGWQMVFTGTKPNFCGNNSVITEQSGTISDGSGDAEYSVNTTCSWRIEPAGGKNLSIHFTSFDVGDGDYINVYDWGSQTLLLNKYSGNTSPADLLAPSGSAYIEFRTDWKNNGQGWEATFTVDNVGVNENVFTEVSVFPVPASEQLNVSFGVEGVQDIELSLLDLAGRAVLTYTEREVRGQMNAVLDVSFLPSGIYFLRASGEKGTLMRKVTLE